MDLYNYYIFDNADPRTHNWFLAGSPFPMLGVISAYLALVYYIVPRFMENRKPFQLTKFIGVYNLFQVFYCIGVVRLCFQAGWKFDYFYRCYETDYSNDPKAVKMVEVSWYILFIKFVELLETILFVLRKKQSQVSFLHVYHHISTFFIAYVFCKYVGGSMLTFSIVINSVVHIIMYSYYFMSASETKIFKFLASKVKKYITSIQLIQFGLLTMNNFFGLQPGCNTCKPFLAMYIPNIFILIYLFSSFYKKTYDTKRTAERKVK
ncbi:elongation of very long chain fatty acids protein 7-like [Topomyia yanbarensis]|uniref:elongation of very long chain fatty acids protein 7-like n=1 Tax=Topomyia yanbarensis TaxID=2498891 RepID=UPI00273B687B|nr:elongation of very long chain fatty acids protein 7-like [Topomyia yanbarensis]XP_058833224.1 elongation of very long chain fatty acids protein 7-like [Topomyia yanbarensis]XP_058833225.1 elongation of very long chain fatty acids protein 7-like [Topomyia yanbarensis]XP_058833226.1 elongation of very long chain fatty acids protein 7-like [Topomyia yanbarensis]